MPFFAELDVINDSGKSVCGNVPALMKDELLKKIIKANKLCRYGNLIIVIFRLKKFTVTYAALQTPDAFVEK